MDEKGRKSNWQKKKQQQNNVASLLESKVKSDKRFLLQK